jgi:hypothetical protein
MPFPNDAVVDPSPQLALAAGLLASLMFVGLAAAPDDILRFVLGEDGLVEIISAVAYLTGLFFALRLAAGSTGLPRAHWVMWAVLCVLFFGEETSWLQHLIGYDTPEAVKAINAQSEFNVHNLNVLTGAGSLVSADGIDLSPKVLRDSELLFYLGFATYFLLVPLSRFIGAIDKLAQRVGIPRMSPRFLLMVWIPIMVSVVVTFESRHDMLRKKVTGESREMIFALTIMAFIAIAFYFVQARKKQMSRIGLPAVGISETPQA